MISRSLDSVRPRNNGRMLPAYLDAQHPEAVRGTTHVRTLDPNLVVGLDTRRTTFQVWGPSLAAGGWIAICDCQDDQGRPFRGTVPWERVCVALREAREGELSVDRAERENARLRAQTAAAADRELEEGAKYWARGIAGELHGWGRWDAADIARGWNSRWT